MISVMSDPIIRFLDDYQLNRRAYLGDGVYVGQDAEHDVWLITARNEFSVLPPTLHYIALDERVQRALLEYLQPTVGSQAGDSD